jgi:hypothetical protein
MGSENRNDWLTTAAVGILAMCAVTFDHEALGHGGVCILLHGHIRLLTSSLFGCDVRSGWIDPAGPLANLLIGTFALVGFRVLPQRLPIDRLFFILVMAFSYFWESAYLMRAMSSREGDLYYFAEFLLGHVSALQRWLAAGLGLAFYIFTVRITSNALLRLCPEARVARTAAQTVWISATLSAGVAALAYAGHGWSDLRDAILEIGGASFPLLFIPARSRRIEQSGPTPVIKRSFITIGLSAVIYAAFIASLGRGIALAP